MLLRTKDVDALRVGHAFLYTGGDITKTAILCGVDPLIVAQLSREHDWDAQISAIMKPGSADVDEERREVNRSINFLQARRLRALVERITSYLEEADTPGLEAFLTVLDKRGKPIPSMKPLLELAKAAETVQGLSYVALGDKQAASNLGTSESKAGDIALHVSRALDKMISAGPMGTAIPVVTEVLSET